LCARKGSAIGGFAKAVARAEQASIDADLGGSVIKQRVARAGGGRSGGYRVLVAYRTGWRSIFLYGFAKNERDNVDERELADLKKLARRYLTLREEEIALALSENELNEMPCHGEERK
jgi:hypothetical protein